MGMVLRGSNVTAASGASASTPIVAGIITLLNDARLHAGLPPMGAVGPFLYSAWAKGGFHDVVEGNNECFETPPWKHGMSVNDTCCTWGFEARPGFDPVSGLGTPNFKVLRELALEMGNRSLDNLDNFDIIGR